MSERGLSHFYDLLMLKTFLKKEFTIEFTVDCDS